MRPKSRGASAISKETNCKPPVTNIDIIDSYYASLNVSDEVGRIQFTNEYRRLFDQASKAWRNLESLNVLPASERLFVTDLID